MTKYVWCLTRSLVVLGGKWRRKLQNGICQMNQHGKEYDGLG
jgi:hypothetical protein